MCQLLDINSLSVTIKGICNVNYGYIVNLIAGREKNRVCEINIKLFFIFK
jgi:hypothetical protein